MLTPRFELSQDDDFIILVIHAPYAKVAETEFHIQDEIVCFYSKPYYLRLHLPNRVLDEDDRNEATYDVDKGTFTAKIGKENKGEEFEGLDMLTKLLTPPDGGEKPKLFSPGLVEEIGSSDLDQSAVSPEQAGNSSEGVKTGYEDDEDDFDWYIEQSVPSEVEGLSGGAKYGFALTKSGMSEKLLEEFSEVLSIRDPDNMSSAEKRQQRLAQEADNFCEEHYLADLYDNDEMSEILKFEPWWSKACADCKLSEEEKDKLLKLPKKKHLIDADVLPTVYLGLVDIVFAYAYNHRVLYGESNTESGWTIAKLAATLSWFESFTSLQDVVVSCVRRALAYPLHRNWQLCEKVLEDVQTLFAGGKKPLLKCLLDVHAALIVSDPHYIFNDLYITDYCVWIQSAKSKKIQSLADALKATVVAKSDVGFELEELENAAALVVKEQESCVGEITSKLGQMGVRKSALDSDDDSNEDDEDSEEDSDEDSSESDTDSDESEQSDETHPQNNGLPENEGVTENRQNPKPDSANSEIA
ncbi:protein SHQ1 homolog [Littorina saxatilis]|uniref:Protein SHQ1 homolog n=1 Tax=Littorina saxatilis TaxID=31220 RepID=A0AAN9GKM9_9CAEN